MNQEYLKLTSMDPETFELCLDKLNIFYPYEEQWLLIKSRKSHTDNFGNPINDGHYYFRRIFSPQWGSEFKLSIHSMETLLMCLFYGNTFITNSFDNLEEIIKKRKRMDLKSLWITNTPES